MGITAISRDWGFTPSIVRITTTDVLATVEATGYLTTQEQNLEIINRGAFQWETGDSALVFASDGSGLFEVSPDFTSLLPDAAGGGSVTLINTGTGLTGGPITTTGTISFADIPPNTFLANVTSGNAPPTPQSSTVTVQSLGFGEAASILVLTDADFAGAGGTYVLNNPPPIIISMAATSPGRVLQLPPSNEETSLQKSQQIELLTGSGSQSIGINDGAGTLINLVESNSAWRAVSNDRSTLAGSWTFLGEVQTINAGNGDVSGNISLTSNDGSVIIDNTIPDQIDFSVASSPSLTLQNAYNNGDGTITIDNTTNSKPFAVGNDENTIFSPYGVYVSATRNLEASPVQPWFHFFEAFDSSNAMVQYGALAAAIKSNTAGSVSGFMQMGAAVGSASGEVLPFFIADGQDEQCVNTYPTLISLGPAVVDASSMLDILSTTRGSRPFPGMTEAQFTGISSKALGLHAFTTDFNLTKYWDGTAEQTYLTVDNVLAGTNVTISQNGDGTITVNSSGSGPGGNADYAGWSFANGGTSTTFGAANTYVPIVIVVGLNDIVSSEFVNEVVSISGNTTPCFRYIGSSTQYFQFNFNLFARGAVVGQKIYRFQASIQRADTSIVQTGFVGGDIVLQDLIFPYAVPLSGVVQLNTGDRLYVSVENRTDTSSVVVQTGNAEIVNVDATQQTAMTWNTVSTTSVSMAPNNGYVLNNAALISATLPVTCNFGSLVQVNGYGAGGFSILQNSGQSIIYEGASTTTGVGGHLDSTNAQACVSLRCIVQDTVFQVENTTGAITLV